MKSENGSVILFIFIIFILILLIVGGLLLFKKVTFLNFKLPGNFVSTSTPGKRDGNLIDVSKNPPAKYLPDYINHCNQTPGYHWSGSSCERK